MNGTSKINAPAADKKADARHMRRALEFLRKGQATVKPAATAASIILSASGRGSIAVPVLTCRDLVANGLAERCGTRLVLLPQGEYRLKRENSITDGFSAQHRDIEMRLANMPGGHQCVAVNTSESPLARISKLKNRSGKRFLDNRERRAGDRLRSEYTRAQLQPRLGMIWQESAGTGGGCGPGGKAGLTDAALSARHRVEAALNAVGPELSGILIDVCCFLKGLETVEHERSWPARSAKVVLKAALAALARHYEPQSASAGGESTIRHWGNQGYRPSLGDISNTG